MTAKPTFLSTLGIAKEAVKGTFVAASDFIPVRSVKARRVPTMLEDKGWRGSAVENYGLVQGPYHGEVDVDGDVFADTIMWHLASILPDVATVGGAAPYTHTAACKNNADGQGTTHALTDFYAVAARGYPYALCSELSFNFNADGLLEYSAKWVSREEAVVATPVAAFGALDPLAAWLAVPTIGAANPTLLDGILKITRKVEPIAVMNNTQTAIQVFGGRVSVTGSLNLLMDDDTYLTAFEANTQGIIDLSFGRLAGAAQQQVKFHMTKTAWRKAEPDRGEEYVKLGLDFEALGNVTDAGASGGYSPLKATVINARPAATFV